MKVNEWSPTTDSVDVRFRLTSSDIDAALPRVEPGLRKYLWLQAHRDLSDLRSYAEYRRRFNAFFRVRRSREWQDKFYDLLETNKTQKPGFRDLLESLYRSTGRYEASFASKLLATIEPHMPVIDSIVLRNLNLSLSAFRSSQRPARIAELHCTLVSCFRDFLATDNGQHIVDRFRASYPDAQITEVKMLDLVLWQTRA